MDSKIIQKLLLLMRNIVHYLLSEFKKMPIFSSITIVNLSIFVILLIIYDKNSHLIEKATFVVLFLTLIILIWYTYETKRMRDIQHKNFIDSKKPLLTVNLSTLDRQKFITSFHITNQKAIFTTAKVYAVLKLDEEDIEISDHYNGKKPWFIQSLNQIVAPIPLAQFIMKDKFKEEDSTYIDFFRENSQKKLKFSISVEYESESGLKNKNRSVNYIYNFNNKSWVLEVDAI